MPKKSVKKSVKKSAKKPSSSLSSSSSSSSSSSLASPNVVVRPLRNINMTGVTLLHEQYIENIKNSKTNALTEPCKFGVHCVRRYKGCTYAHTPSEFVASFCPGGMHCQNYQSCYRVHPDDTPETFSQTIKRIFDNIKSRPFREQYKHEIAQENEDIPRPFNLTTIDRLKKNKKIEERRRFITDMLDKKETWRKKSKEKENKYDSDMEMESSI